MYAFKMQQRLHYFAFKMHYLLFYGAGNANGFRSVVCMVVDVRCSVRDVALCLGQISIFSAVHESVMYAANARMDTR